MWEKNSTPFLIHKFKFNLYGLIFHLSLQQWMTRIIMNDFESFCNNENWIGWLKQSRDSCALCDTLGTPMHFATMKRIKW